MRKYIVLFLISGIVWAQTDYDKLVLKNGKEYLGEYVKTEKEKVYFNSHEEYVFPLVRHKRKVQTLQLKDGTFVINNPPRSEWTIKEKAIYDAKKDARRWLIYPSFAILLTGVSIHSYFYFFWEEGPEGDTPLNNILMPATGASALVGSYHLFSKLDKNNIEGIIATDNELYKKMYYKQFKKQKLKNIMISIGSKALIAGTVTLILFHNFGFGSDYDVWMGP